MGKIRKYLKASLSVMLCAAVLVPATSCQKMVTTAAAMKALDEHMTEIGCFAHFSESEVYLSDVTGDGNNDYCVTVTMGSGIMSDMVVVYDGYKEKFYELNGRKEGINYEIVNAFNNNLNVTKSMNIIGWEEGSSNEGIPGRAVLENGELVFKPNH